MKYITEQEKDKLIFYTIKKFINTNLEKDSEEFLEYYSVCNLGIAQALNAFNPNKGVKFTTFAIYCMKNQIYSYYKKNKNWNYSLDTTIIGAENINYSDTLIAKDCFTESENEKLSKEVYKVLREYLTNFFDMSKGYKPFKNKDYGEVLIKCFIDYTLFGVKNITQKHLGEFYGVAQTTISKIYIDFRSILKIYWVNTNNNLKFIKFDGVNPIFSE